MIGIVNKVKSSRMRCFAACVLFAYLLSVPSVMAVAPHELLVLANRNEPVSVRIAQAYIQRRQIPRQNLVLLDLAASADYVSMSRASFTREVWMPAQRAISQRRLDHILAWVFSTHIPFRVDHNPPVSLQGLVFVRNELPGDNAIVRAEYVSPLFAGPAAPQGQVRASHSFAFAAEGLGSQMPIPSMTLGYIGTRGNSEEQILQIIERGKSADGTSPRGVVYFVTQDDIRSRVREWQYGPVAETLRSFRREAVVTNALPQGAAAVIGIMMGAADVDLSGIGSFVPGAMGEHLTSFGATFDQAGQTKVTRWVDAGVTGTAGTVTEPLAIWAKFPHARFYVHYLSGCTLIESYYLSVRTPLQTMFLGDPLVAPWAVAASLRIAGIAEGEVVTDPRSIDLHIQAPFGTQYGRVVYLLNGQIAGEGTSFVLDPASLPPGLHELRAVAYRAGFIQSPVFDVVRFRITP
ncbi:MAG: TIGR03790 family protein [Kiritimatiellia bacterium]